MSKIRVGFSSDWNITGNNVGFGTTNPAALLDVADTLKADFNITGVTTLTAYGGFVAQNQHVTEPSKIGIATVGVGTFQQYYETDHACVRWAKSAREGEEGTQNNNTHSH